MKHMKESEIELRHIQSNTNSNYLNIDFGDSATPSSSILSRTIQALQRLNISLLPSPDNVMDYILKDLVLLSDPVVVNEKTFLPTINKFLKQRYGKDLLDNYPTNGHSYFDLMNSTISNSFNINYKALIGDKEVKFTILGRNNCPVTNEMRHKRDHSVKICTRCSLRQNHSLQHILNNCTSNMEGMIQRHDSAAAILVETLQSMNEYLIIFQNKPIFIKELPQLPVATRHLRPNVWFARPSDDDKLSIEIIEFTCPYGELSDHRSDDRESTLVTARRDKRSKYAQLIRDLRNVVKVRANLYVAVISSLGAVPKDTIHDMDILLGKNPAHAMLKRMVAAIVSHSYKIFHNLIVPRVLDSPSASVSISGSEEEIHDDTHPSNMDEVESSEAISLNTQIDHPQVL